MSLEETMTKARERAKQMGLPYEGALTPAEAYELMREDKSAKLVDVRSRAELDWVGRIPGAVELELLAYPGSRPNPDFLRQLEQKVDKQSRVMFICRSGGRSHNAATVATQAGYGACYNVLEGFEGDKDAEGHRNTKGGWRHAKLPWTQS
ncbi:MAG: rhodanese-like domain-containing protein [Burkholderiales bacterium]